MNEVLPWLNLLLVPVVGLLLRIENRVTRLEARGEAERDLRRILPCSGETARG